MKRSIHALLLTAAVALSLSGCTDNPAPLVGTNEVPAALEKHEVILFTAREALHENVSPGEVKFVGQRMIITGLVDVDSVISDCDYMDGLVRITFNASFDANMEGPAHGTYVLTPTADFDGGVWEGTWKGFQKMTGASELTMYVTQVGHGRGGSLEGMKQFCNSVYVNGAGLVEGEIKSH